jgi:hypothetical protein
MLIPTTVHLALVCPRDLLAGRPSLRGLVYALGAIIAAVYEVFLYQPAAYSIVHIFARHARRCRRCRSRCAAALALDREPGPLGRKGIRALLAGTVLGSIVPAVVFGLSGATGGMLPVNTIVAFPRFFPLLSVVALWRLRPTSAVAIVSEPQLATV